MGLGEFIKGQFIDVIEYVDISRKLLVTKYERYGDEIKNGASLIVREGQVAIFLHQGKLADVFMPGSYSLTTNNLPILSSLKAVPKLLNSPIKSDLYFINMNQFIGNKWGTKNPILIRDEDFGVVRITSFGTYSFRIQEPKVFIQEVFGARRLCLTYDILEFLNSYVSEAIASVITNSGIALMDLATTYRTMGEGIKEKVNEKVVKLGIAIEEVVVENIGLPPEVEKLVDEQSGLNLAAKDMETYVQYQTVRAMRDASMQEGGLAGLGAGFAFGNQMMNTINNTSAPKEKTKMDEIREYKQLLEEGIISQEDFDALKKKILGL